MKKRDWQNTPFIAVMMMLVAVVATLLFTEAPGEEPPPSIEELAPVLGEWVPAWANSVWDDDYLKLRFTLWQDLSCTVNRPGYNRVNYTYDRNRQTITVHLSDSPEEKLTYRLTEHYGFPALQLGDQYYVRQIQYDAFRKHLALQEDLQPPVIVQRTEAELAPILGEWKGVMVGSIYYSVQSVIFNKDMTCRVLPNAATYPYNYDPESGIITVYVSQQLSYATNYQVAEIEGFPVLVNRNKIGFTDAFSWNVADANYVRPEDYDAVYAIYDVNSLEGKLRRHQATAKILLEGKTSFDELAPYRKEGCLTIYNLASSADDGMLNVFMSTPEGKPMKISEAFYNVRLVSTSMHEDWTQNALEQQYSTTFSQIFDYEGAEVTADSNVYTEWSPTDEAYPFEYLFMFKFKRFPQGFDQEPLWTPESLAYQDLFVFFEIYGEEGTFYVQLDK